LGERAANVPEFHESKDCFGRLNNRATLHNIRLARQSASAYNLAALQFIKKSAKILDKGVIVLVRVFTLKIQNYFRKKMPA
jgi:hypothetical protein